MNIFLDCGFYRGATLRNYINDGTVDKTWIVYAFEPNRDLKTTKYLKDFPFPVKINLIKAAVWTSDKKLAFHISGREDSASLKNTTGHTTPKEITIKAINFPKFVKELPEAYIVCSMDIEGAEYPVLKKMLKDGSIDRINVLDIEFHHRFMNDFTDKHSQELIDKIEKRGVEVKLKVPLC
jgi:FkbM family methyltransferase